MENEKIYKSLDIVLIIFVIILLVVHSQFSFCQYDESFYVSTAKRLFEGDKLILDEWHPAQFYSPLILPFYAIYHYVIPSNDGIIIYFRIISIIFSGFVGIMWYLSVSERTYRVIAVMTAIIIVLFSRANIPGLSYYNLCTRFVILAFLLWKKSEKEGDRTALLRFLCGIAISAAVLCQPYFGVFVIIFSIVLFSKKKKIIIQIFKGILFSAILYILFFLSYGNIHDYFNNIHFVLTDPDHTRGVKYIFLKVLKGHYRSNFLIVWVGVCILSGWSFSIWRKKEHISNGYFLFQMILCAVSIIKPTINMSSIPCYSLLGGITIVFFPSILYMILSNKWNDDIILYLLGIAVAFSFGFGSNTGYDAMLSGYSISCIAALMCINNFMQKDLINKKGLYTKALYIWGVITLIILFAQRLLGFYIDADITKLNRRIEKGPATGIITTEEIYHQYNTILNVLNDKDIFQDRSARIIHSYRNPLGYLASDLKCGSETTWFTELSDSRETNYLKLHPQNSLYICVYTADMGSHERNSFNNHYAVYDMNLQNLDCDLYKSINKCGEEIYIGEYMTVYYVKDTKLLLSGICK